MHIEILEAIRVLEINTLSDSCTVQVLVLAIARVAQVSVLTQFANQHPKCVERKNLIGWVPVHIAAQQYATLEVVQYLGDKCPKALEVKAVFDWYQVLKLPNRF